MLKFSASLACLTGVILAVGVIILNGTDWQYWPFFLFGAVLVLVGGLEGLRGTPRGPHLLVWAWGFMAGMGWMGASIIVSSSPDTGDIPALSGILLGIGGIGLLTAMFGIRQGEK